MGMTIDEAVKHMAQARYDYCEYWEETKNDTTIAYDVAIETMRKYQKIQNIVKAWNDMNSFDSMVQISEVVEDGKN